MVAEVARWQIIDPGPLMNFPWQNR